MGRFQVNREIADRVVLRSLVARRTGRLVHAQAAPAAWSLLQAARRKPSVVLQDAPEEGTRRKEPTQVWLHNDDVTPADYVVRVLEQVFRFGWWKANWIMTKAHVTGAAFVGLYPREEAEAKVKAAHQRARGDGWPLRFSREEA
jgi:ATP-dependent Clp protease adaptor protein ClpS